MNNKYHLYKDPSGKKHQIPYKNVTDDGSIIEVKYNNITYTWPYKKVIANVVEDILKNLSKQKK